ncbi:MAG: hypothetical protein U0V74_02715 [Chitinophagales bacterium]
MDISSYFRVLFTEEKINHEKLKKFTEDHIRRLSANNPKGVFTKILSDISDCYLAYFGPASDSQISVLVQESKQKNAELVKALLVEDVKSLFPFVSYKFSNQPEIINEFYPAGAETFKNGLDDADLDNRLMFFGETLRKYESDFLPADVNDFYRLESSFRQNNNLNGVKKEGETNDNEKNLRIQLTKNALTIAMHFVGFPEKGKDYFDPALLF